MISTVPHHSQRIIFADKSDPITNIPLFADSNSENNDETVYYTPELLLQRAFEYLAKNDPTIASELAWAAAFYAVKILYLNIGLHNISHRSTKWLAEFAIDTLPAKRRNSNRSGGGGRNEISKKSVYQLAFPKNTCVLRFADLNSQNIADTIWLIENHILIRKLELEGPIAGGKPTFFRFTNRYQGWFYDEPWDFMPLTSVSNTSSKSVDGALTILFPTVEMIEKGYEIAQRQRLQQRISHSSEMSAREQLEQKVQQLKAIKSRRKKGKKNNNNNNNDNDNEEEEEEEGNENEENGENEMMEEEDEDECLIDEEATLSSPQGISAEMFDVDD
uniref:Uncharacterized protein n=1 Tax=Panagrolaimus sp. ES5 TaxID=591445 RepID=A0AC34FIR9_9BILA